MELKKHSSSVFIATECFSVCAENTYALKALGSGHSFDKQILDLKSDNDYLQRMVKLHQ